MKGTRDAGDSKSLQCGAGNPGSSGFVPRFYLFSSSQFLSTSLEETGFENHTTDPVPDQACGQGLPQPNSSIQAKKVSAEVPVEMGCGKSPKYGLRCGGLASLLSTCAFPADGASRPPPKEAAEP